MTEKKSEIKAIHIGSFEELIVKTNIDVLLLQDDTLHSAFVEGDKKMVNTVTIKMSGKKLIIESSEKHSFKNKVIVTVPVSGLKILNLNGNSTVGFINDILWKEGTIILNGVCRNQAVQ